jgi:hypothetical protein
VEYTRFQGTGSWRRFAVHLATFGLLTACEAERREYPKDLLQPSPSVNDRMAPNSTDVAGAAVGASGEESPLESSTVTQLRPADGAERESPVDTSRPSACVEGATESCGPPREEGVCKFGARTCRNGMWGDCVGAIFAENRDCSSTADNDCDGQPDDTLDDVCRCPVGGSQACDEHEGLDGKGPCRAGKQTCVLAQGNASSDWGPCSDSVAPGGPDSCSVAGDDANCDGTPNGGCTCVEGTVVPCGPQTDAGICQRGTSTCRNGAFSVCQGAVFPGRRDCSSPQDNDCDGLPDDTTDTTCTCIIGDTQSCGAHPDRDGNGTCRAGTQVCEAGAQNVTSRFGACNGSIGPAQRDLCTTRGDDSDCNGMPNGGCQCIAGGGNAPCSGDANNSRCSPQGTCAPCQANADCSLVSGGRSSCSAGRCVSARCGDGVVTAGEACDDGNSIETDACTSACQPGLNLPVVTVQRFAWTSRLTPVDMGSTQGRACFLTRVGGAFNAAADGVSIQAQGGRWVLTGTIAVGGFVEAAAGCVAASGVSDEFTWRSGQATVQMPSAATNTCFLTRVAGAFQGGGESVGLRQEAGTWNMRGDVLQDSILTSARCIAMSAHAASIGMALATPSPVLLDSQLNGACPLTFVGGDFGAEGDLVESEWNGQVWQLQRQVGGTRSLRASAVCFGRNDGSGVSPLR